MRPASPQVHVGDWVDFIVWPRATQDCDGIFLVDMQVWEDDGMGRQHKEEESPATEVGRPTQLWLCAACASFADSLVIDSAEHT